MESSSKTYETRQKRRSSGSAPKSRVDWKRTKLDTISCILDSDEASTSEEEEDEADSTSISAEESEEQKTEVSGADEGGEDRIRRPHRKSKSVTIASSDSSSDSDGPGTRVASRRCRAIAEDDEDKENNGAGGAGSSEDEEAKAQIKKQKRMESLKQLAARRRSRNQTIGSESGEESLGEEFTPITPESLDEVDDDSQEMADFIEKDDEEDEDGNRLTFRHMFWKHKIAQFACDDLYSHLEKVINAFLINIADNSFLETLYEGSRQKRYAKDMLKSLNYLDERVIAPRLEKLTTSCRWTKNYKERINSYPQLLVRVIEAEEQSCEACNLKRHCAYLLTLSGGAYDCDTLEKDDFLLDDKQMLVVGTTCAHRTEVYHPVKHYKYHLYQRCIPFLHDTEEESANERVEEALSKMEEKQFIKKEVERLESLVKSADFFQHEELESLIS